MSERGDPDVLHPGEASDEVEDPENGQQGDEGGGWRTSRLMPLAIVLVATVVILGLVLAARGEQHAGLTVLGRGTVDEASLPVTVPFRYLAGHIVVDVALGNGAGTVPMLLDTGSPTVVAGDLAAVHGGEPAGTISSLSLDGEVASSPVVPLPSLHIGRAAFQGVGAVEGWVEPGDPLYCLSEAGLLGASLMQHAVWQIDYATQRLTIAPSIAGLDHVDGALRLEFDRASEASPSPLLKLPVGDGVLHVLLDTGSDGWLAVHPEDVSEAGVDLPEDAPAMDALVSGAAGAFPVHLAWTAVDLGVGDVQLEHLPIAVSEAIPEGQGNLGNGFLDDFVVTIDWTQDALYLDPVAGSSFDPASAPRPDPPASATVTWQDGFVLGSLVPGTADAAPGMAPTLGTRVTAIDGVDVTDAAFEQACAFLLGRSPAPTQLRLVGEPPPTVRVAPVDAFFEALEH